MGRVMSKSAEKSLMVLKAVGYSDRPLGLIEIAGLTGLDKSTTARLLAVLADAGFVRRDSATRCYSSGPTLVSLSSFSMGQISLVKVAKTDLIRLRDLTEETVSLHIREQLFRVCVDGAESLQSVRRAVPWGGRLPLYEGPTGKSILAYLPDDDRKIVLKQAEAAGLDAESISAALVQIRANGYSLVVGDRTPGIGAISVPIFDRDGVVGSITVAGPSERWNVGRMKEFVSEVLSVAKNISALLGSPLEA